MKLENKVAIVTGSTSGIGLAIAKLYASEGAKVVIAARKEELANKIVSEIKADGGEAMFAKLEVSSKKDWGNVINRTVAAYGSIHILVNNAGTNEPCTFPKIEFEQWDKVMAINVTGPAMGIQLCAPYMKEAGGGAIVNISSLAGMQGTPNAAYSTSKWALIGLSASAAYSYAGWGIRSNTISPGFIQNTNLTKAISTKMGGTNPMDNIIALGRSGEPVELAQAALFFASEDSSYITGVNIAVDGGLTSAGHYSMMRPQMSMFTEGRLNN